MRLSCIFLFLFTLFLAPCADAGLVIVTGGSLNMQYDGSVFANVSAWWFANDAVLNAGGSWVSFGGLSMRYDASRVGLGYSGWGFANQLGGIGDIFDTRISASI